MSVIIIIIKRNRGRGWDGNVKKKKTVANDIPPTGYIPNVLRPRAYVIIMDDDDNIIQNDSICASVRDVDGTGISAAFERIL